MISRRDVLLFFAGPMSSTRRPFDNKRLSWTAPTEAIFRPEPAGITSTERHFNNECHSTEEPAGKASSERRFNNKCHLREALADDEIIEVQLSLNLNSMSAGLRNGTRMTDETRCKQAPRKAAGRPVSHMCDNRAAVRVAAVFDEWANDD